MLVSIGEILVVIVLVGVSNIGIVVLTVGFVGEKYMLFEFEFHF